MSHRGEVEDCVFDTILTGKPDASIRRGNEMAPNNCVGGATMLLSVKVRTHANRDQRLWEDCGHCHVEDREQMGC
jgi:hypothetical protein